MSPTMRETLTLTLDEEDLAFLRSVWERAKSIRAPEELRSDEPTPNKWAVRLLLEEARRIDAELRALGI